MKLELCGWFYALIHPAYHIFKKFTDATRSCNTSTSLSLFEETSFRRLIAYNGELFSIIRKHAAERIDTESNFSFDFIHYTSKRCTILFRNELVFVPAKRDLYRIDSWLHSYSRYRNLREFIFLSRHIISEKIYYMTACFLYCLFIN